MEKNTARNRSVTALLLALSAALVLAGCFNPLDPVEPATKTDAGYLSVSIAGQGGGERTLYPNEAFTKYELTFASEGKSYGPKTLTGTSSEAFNDIPVGTWTITAKGYVTINGQDYAAAEGSATASIEAGKPASVSIVISATQKGDNGFFYYNVSFPAGKVDTATLTLSRFDASGSYYDNFAPIADPIDLKISSSGYFNGESSSGLTPGYYRVDIRLENAYQRAGISEVVHIYSNMETKAEYAYTEADFVDFVTLSGTVTATVNGQAPARVSISARDEQDYEIGYTFIDPYSADASWSVSVPAFDAASTVTFDVYLYDSSDNQIGYAYNISPTTVHESDVSNISLIVDYSAVTLSGTVTATVNGKAPDFVSIFAYAESNWIGNTFIDPYSADASWSISVPAFDAVTTVTFEVGLYDSSYNYLGSVSGLNPTQVHNQEVSNIGLSVEYSAVTMSGTVTATVNGEAPSRVYISAYAGDTSIGSTFIDPYSAGASWSISVPAFDAATTVTFMVYLYDSSGDYIGSVSGLNPTQVHNQEVSNISLSADYSATILSGTIGTVTIDGAPPPYWFGIQAFSRNGTVGEVYGIENGAWSITLSTQNIQSGEEISIMFIAGLEGDGPPYIFKHLATRTYNGGSISDIALDDVAITTRTVSGTVVNLLGGIEEAYVVPLSAIPDSGSIADGLSYMVGQAMIDDSTGGWSLKVPDAPASLWFVVMVNGDESPHFFVTNEASSATTVPLNIGAMTELEL